MFEKITCFLPQLKEGQYGKTVVFRVKGGRRKYVEYSRVVQDFESAVFRFVDEHPEMRLTDYYGILREAGVRPDSASLKDADASAYDGRTVMALIVGSIRAERFCDGALLGSFESGCIRKWLERLAEIDSAG